MEFACHTWAFNNLDLSEALGTVARMGFRYVDLGSGPHLETAHVARDPRGVAAAIRRDLVQFNLKLSDIYLMLPRISLADEEKRQRDMGLFKALLPFVVALDAPGVTLSPGLTHPRDDTAAMDRTVAALREMVDAARAATPATHLAVSIEPHMDSMAQQPEAALKILGQVDGLQLTLDWSHLVYQNIDHADIVKLLAHARHVQVRQAAPKKLQTVFNDGRVDAVDVVHLLHEAEYSGVVCVEYMQTTGWHGMVEVDSVLECSQMRDALREARDAYSSSTRPKAKISPSR
jgi:sugar phosphate isomerase/epimerase